MYARLKNHPSNTFQRAVLLNFIIGRFFFSIKSSPFKMTEKETDVTWALDLLTAKEDYEFSAFPYGYPIILGAIGFTVACGANLLNKRPMISGIQKHIFLTGATGTAGYWYQKRAERLHAERDAVLRHYITLHPEDFPPPDRKQWKDVLAEWVPIR